MDAVDVARRFADEWQHAWREHDVGRAAALYTDDAIFRWQPFRSPAVPLEHIKAVFDAEKPGADVRFAPGPAGDGHAAVEWWAQVSRGGDRVTYAGVSLLQFDERGLVTEERSYWHSEDGWHEPTPTWGGP